MQNKLPETMELLKEIYKICIMEDYEKIQENIMTCILNLDKICGFFQPKLQNNLQKTLIPKEGGNVMFDSNKNLVKFDLYKTDKRNSEYYFYPTNENEFKKEAYESGQVSVKVIHPDGKTETPVRNVSKVWDTSVYWNINSMYSKYILDKTGKKKHYSNGCNLKVYACPIAYKDSIPS